MALAYLLCPTFQIENTAGKPATGGWLEVYIAGSREKYYCASDFNGTLHPFRIELDSLGSNIVLADETNAYDVYVYNRYGGLMMSRYGVKPGAGGGISAGSITSTDGSIIVTPTANGVDLRVDSELPTSMRCSAADLQESDTFEFVEEQRNGADASVNNNGQVVVNSGWWHYDVVVRLKWPANPAENTTSDISLHAPNGSSSSYFDRSYSHDETLQLSGEYKCTQDGTVFPVSIQGVPSGMTVELVDFGIHSVTGEGGGGGIYNAGEGIIIDEPNRVISVDTDTIQEKLTAGTGITIDNDGVISVNESAINEIFPVTYNVTTFNEIRTALIAGKLPVLFRNDPEEFAVSVQRIPIYEFFDGGSYKYAQFWTPYVYTSPSAAYPPYADFEVYSASYDTGSGTTTWSTLHKYFAEQSDWAEADAKKLTFIKNKPDLSVYATQTELTNGLATKQDTISDLSDIRAGAQAGSTAVQPATLDNYQEKLTAGSNVQISAQNVISATDTTYTAGNGLTLSGTEFAIDTSVVATKSDIPEDKIFYVDVANPNYDTALAAYNAGKTLVLKGDCYTGYLCRYTPMDGLVFAYNLPWTVAGIATATQVGYMAMRKVTDTGKTYWYGFSSCAIPNATREDSGKVLTVSGSNVAAWTSLPDLTPYVTDTELSTILEGYQTALTAGANIQINNGTISSTDTTYTAGTGLDLTGTEFSVDTTTIATKADLADYTPTASLGAVALSNDYDDLDNKPVIPVLPTTKDLVAGSNITITEGQDTVTIAATAASYSAGSGLNLTGSTFSVDTTTIQEKLTAGSNITISGNTISSTAVPQLQANWAEGNTQSVQYIMNKPTIPVLPSTKNLVAGDNITLTEGNDDITVACSITIGTVTV